MTPIGILQGQKDRGQAIGPCRRIDHGQVLLHGMFATQTHLGARKVYLAANERIQGPAGSFLRQVTAILLEGASSSVW